MLAALGIVVLAAPLWLPLFGTLLAVDDGLQPADVALVLEGTGTDAADAAEAWRQQGIVRDVVIVEAPVKTHALVAYWSDFVRWGLAAPATTPPDHLSIVRAPSTQAAQQATRRCPRWRHMPPGRYWSLAAAASARDWSKASWCRCSGRRASACAWCATGRPGVIPGTGTRTRRTVAPCSTRGCRCWCRF